MFAIISSTIVHTE